MSWRIAFVLAACAAALAAQTDSFTIVDYPGSTTSATLGINNAGDIVGRFTDTNNQTHGYLFSGGKFTQIDFPGAVTNTQAIGINSRGDIVGGYNDGTRAYGYLLSQGKFTSLDCPGAAFTAAMAINSAGDIVGYMGRQGKPQQGFLWSRGVCTVFEYRPEAPSTTATNLYGINDAGVMTGYWISRTSTHSIVYDKGKFTEFVYGPGDTTWVWGINNAGDIAGSIYDASRRWYAFLLRNGRFTVYQVPFPGAIETTAGAINDSGQIVGEWRDAQRIWRGYVARVTPAGPPPPTLTVDDDGVECPGALRTVQEAVARAVAFSTIRVCPGTYRRTVNIIGPEKNGLKLIAEGRQDEVVLHGDYTERDAFHLENVSNVLIRGFTVRDFGVSATTASDWGVGNQIYLENAHYNTIEHNRLIDGDRMGIMLVDSGNNLVQNNVAWAVRSELANCGIHVEGAKSANNTIRLNMFWANKLAGVMIRGAGAGNRIQDNTVLSNGRFGIEVEDTSDIWIEGNRVSYGRGFWGGAMPGGQQPALGINLVNVNKATVFDNRARSNPGTDLNWDGKGENSISANACETSTPAGVCAR
jgi:parallel beta-helix repeat protein/probable HAF family extracellular repeat protein